MVDFRKALVESRAKRLREEHSNDVNRVLRELDEEVEFLEIESKEEGFLKLAPHQCKEMADTMKEARALLAHLFLN